MRPLFWLILSISFISRTGLGQEAGNTGIKILFHGIVMDADSFIPLPNSQIIINSSFSSVSGSDGTFAFYVNKSDTVVFSSLGYKTAILYVSDTLSGRDFNAGIYMHSDTLLIGEVIIVPRISNLKSEILNARSKIPSTMDNARYNVAISAYQGRNSINHLGDPATNYELLRQKQRVDAYERGGIPSDQIAGFSPLLLIPAAYLLIHGLPESPAPYKHQLTNNEVDELQKKYFETVKTGKH
jgi:hypothetical protein